MSDMSENILEVKDLSFSFRTYGGTVKAVRDVSFDLRRGEILGIVGESGCGKSVTAQSILKLNPEPPGFFEGGSIVYNGEDLVKKTDKQMRKIRGRHIGFIFQDPMTSLNPTMRIGKQVEEIFAGDKKMTRAQKRQRALALFEKLGISDPERRLNQYPHELSGGMKQRVMIAIALVGEPDIIIADEPTTSLDVTIEAQILQILKEMSRETHTSVMIITHDLGVIAKLCDRVLVMYGGEIMERGGIDDIFYRTAHPYTSGLMHSIARLDMSRDEELKPIEGSPPDLFAPPRGCPFAARCEYAMEICGEQPAPQTELADGHSTRCWLRDPHAPDVDLTYQGGGVNVR